MAVVDEAAFVEAFEYEVEEGDHFNGEVDELVVKFAVEVLEVRALHLEDRALHQLEVVQLVPVDQFSHHLSIRRPLRVLERQYELLQCGSHLLHRDVGPVDEGGLFARLRVAVLHVLRGVGVVRTVV